MATTFEELDPTQYLEIVSSTTDGFMLGNSTGVEMRMIFADAQPAANAAGFYSINSNGGTASRFATGKVWVRGSGNLAVDLL